MEIKIIKEPIRRDELESFARAGFGDMVKAAVDVEQEIMAIGGELHMDELEELLEKENSKHQNIWGINLYIEKTGDDFIEFDSMVNLKPAFGNRTRGVDDPETREKISGIVNKLIK
ncbi:MAG: DUF5674 family protein [Candidatus Pacebacteria bacterium]|nr:DUF5674 family protein [Candidatus Paceibacterota bacterium]